MKKKTKKPKKFEPVLGVIEYREAGQLFFEAEVVLWDGTEWTLQFGNATEVVKVISWQSLPVSIQKKIQKAYDNVVVCDGGMEK
jgi:hypothetical protein